MARYCPFLTYFKTSASRYAVIFILFFLFFPLSVAFGQSGGLFDACGAGFPTCGTGLSCVKGECLGTNGYITDDPQGCSPDLIWKDNRCVIDIEGPAGKLGLGEGTKDIRDNIRTVINIALGFVGVLGVIMIIYTGFLWMFAGGNEDRVKKAKQSMVWIAVGLLVIGSAWTIASYFLSIGQKLGGAGSGSSGGNGGGGVGIPPPGGVVEQFSLDDVENSRTDPEVKNKGLYLCSALQARFNHSVDAKSFEASKNALVIKQKTAESENIDDWKTISPDIMPSYKWSQSGQYIIFEHPGDNTNLFEKTTQYAAVYPRTLTDTGNPSFPLANCTAIGCDSLELNGDRVVWRFETGSESDSEKPDINSSGTYPKVYSETDQSYPSRGVSPRPTIVIAFNEPILANSAVETITDSQGAERIVPRNGVFEFGAFIPSSGDIVSKNMLITGSGLKIIENKNFVTRFEDYGYGSRLVIQLAPEAVNLISNGWYQIKISGVKDLCGNIFDGERHFHFQVSGAVPRLDPTPPNNLTKVCYQNIAVGVISNISMYDVVKDSCSVGPSTGENGFVTDGSLTPITNRFLIVMDDLPPKNSDERKLITNYDQYCRKYFFEPKDVALSPEQKYQAEIKTRFPIDEKGTLLSTIWSFETAKLGEKCVYPPILTSVSPTSGGKGQCIGIIGEHINYFSDDTVRTDLTNSQEIIELQKINQNKSVETCANISAYIDKNPEVRWGDTNILTKMQEGETPSLPINCDLASDSKTFRIVEHIVDDANNLKFFSTSIDFTVTNQAVGPCLEKITPESTVRGSPLTLTGSDFGSYEQGKSSAVYFYEKPDTILKADAWTDTKITSTIPFPANTGNVYIKNKDGVSNVQSLTLPPLILVKEFLRETCAPYISPNPKENQGQVITTEAPAVCVLGEGSSEYIPVYLEFYSEVADITDLTGNSEFAKPAYYHIFTCDAFDVADSGCREVADSIQNLALRRIIPNPSTPQIVHSAIEFQIKNPAFNQVYKIVIDPIIDDNGIATPADFKGYSWQFKTMATADELCKQVKTVTVTLDPLSVQVPNSSEAQATADNYQCQSFASAEFSWNADQPYVKVSGESGESWEKVENGTPIAPIAQIPQSNSPRITIQSLNSSYSEAKAYITATATKVDGFDILKPDQKTNDPPAYLTIRNSAYCESDNDCNNNCSGSSQGAISCDQTTHQCNPYVKGLSPDKGKVNDWVTVFGCYFGADTGKVNFKQGNTVPALTGPFPTECKNTVWTDTQIITIVPGGLKQTGTGDPQTPPKADILVTTLQQKQSADDNKFSKFTVDENTVNRPQICAVQNQIADGDCKDNPCGSPRDAVIVIGKGLEKATSAKFTNSATSKFNESDVSEPSDESIKSTVPIESENGEHKVSVVSSVPESNSLQFQVYDDGKAHLIGVSPLKNIIEPCKSDDERDFCQTYKGKPYSGNAYISFDHSVACGAMSDCIKVFSCTSVDECGTQLTQITYEPEIIDEKTSVKIIKFYPVGGFLMGNHYKVELNKTKLTTSTSNKQINCGSITDADNKCAWSFTLDKQVVPNSIKVEPQTAVIILTPGDPAADNPPPTYTAEVKDADNNNITDVVSIEWSVSDSQAISIAPEFSSKTTVVTAKDLGNKVYKLGTYNVTAKVTGSNVSNSATVTIKNDATLHISGVSPQPNALNSCANSTISISFDKPIDPNTYKNSVIMMVEGTSSNKCFNLAAEQNRGIFGKFLNQLARIFGIFLGQAADSYTNCNDNDVKIDLISPTTIVISPFSPGVALIPGTEYKVKVFGTGSKDPNHPTGITASNGMPLWATSIEGCASAGIDIGVDETERTCSYTFKTRAAKTDDKGNSDKGLCALTHAAVIETGKKPPPDNSVTFFKKDEEKNFSAQGYTGDATNYSAPINPVAGVYEWTFDNWRIDPNSGILSLKPSVDKANVKPIPDAKGNLVAGDANIAVSVSSINAYGNTGVNADPKTIKIAPAHISIRPCDIDGNNGAQLFWEFKDITEPKVNFSFSYCQKPTESSQTLPRLSSAPVAISSSTSRGVLKEYFLVFNPEKCDNADSAPDCKPDPNYDPKSANDKLLVRVFPASDYFVPKNGIDPLDQWYKTVEQNPDIFPDQEAAQPINPVDGYSARKTKTAYYIHALNVGFNGETPNEIYSNVFVLAVTENASAKTIDVLNQLVKNWKFNTNIDETLISKLKRDYKRVRDLSVLGGELVDYYNFYGKYPELLDSKVTGVAVSAWDNEWRTNTNGPTNSLAAALSLTGSLPLDPLDPIQSQSVVADLIKNNCLNSDSPTDLLYKCLWGDGVTLGESINQCLIDGDYVVDTTEKFTVEDLQKLGLGYDVNNTDATNPIVDAVELYTCYNNEAQKKYDSDPADPAAKTSGDYYCRGQNSRVYQYVAEKNQPSFTLYGNLEYTKDASVWCSAWGEIPCATWSGGLASLCEWKDSKCVPHEVVQPICASALPDANGSRVTSPKTNAFNFIFKP